MFMLIRSAMKAIVLGTLAVCALPNLVFSQDSFYLYQLEVYCGDPQVATVIFSAKGSGSMGTHVFCAGNCRGRNVPFVNALATVPAGVAASFRTQMQQHEQAAAAGQKQSIAKCLGVGDGKKCDQDLYNDYLRKRQTAMELYKHASDLRLTATKLVAEYWGEQSDNLRFEGEKEVAGDLVGQEWERYAPLVRKKFGQSRSRLWASWTAKKGVPYAVEKWNVIGWIADAALIARKGLGTAADWTDYQDEAQEATKKAEEMWRKALADYEAWLKQAPQCLEESRVAALDKERLERAKAAIEDWDNNQVLYRDPIRNESVTYSEAVRRASEYLKTGKIGGSIFGHSTPTVFTFAALNDEPSKEALRKAIAEVDKAIASFEKLDQNMTKYLQQHRSIIRRMDDAFGSSPSAIADPKLGIPDDRQRTR